MRGPMISAVRIAGRLQTLRRAILIALLLLVFAAGARAEEKSSPPIFGSPNAQHTLTVWGSFTCHFTVRLLQVLSSIVRDSNGTVNIQWRHLPAHNFDPLLHAVSLAETPRFWNFASQVMAAYMKGDDPEKWNWEKIVEIGKAAGVREEALIKARDNQENWEIVQQDFLAAKLLRIEKTPGLFYNGYFMTPDGLPQDIVSFDKSLRAMLNVAPAQPAPATAK